MLWGPMICRKMQTLQPSRTSITIKMQINWLFKILSILKWKRKRRKTWSVNVEMKLAMAIKLISATTAMMTWIQIEGNDQRKMAIILAWLSRILANSKDSQLNLWCSRSRQKSPNPRWQAAPPKSVNLRCKWRKDTKLWHQETSTRARKERVMCSRQASMSLTPISSSIQKCSIPERKSRLFRPSKVWFRMVKSWTKGRAKKSVQDPFQASQSKRNDYQIDRHLD